MALKNVKNKFYFTDVEKKSIYLNCFFLFLKKICFHLLFPTLLNLDLYRGYIQLISIFFINSGIFMVPKSMQLFFGCCKLESHFYGLCSSKIIRHLLALKQPPKNHFYLGIYCENLECFLREINGKSQLKLFKKYIHPVILF